MKKCVMDFRLVENTHLNEKYSLLTLTPVDGVLPEINPGQFCQVRIDDSKSTYLRRPISINFVDYEASELWLLVRDAGEGTHSLLALESGRTVNLMLPLGNGFTASGDENERMLLVGGGVGVAPLLYFGKKLKDSGQKLAFLLGARSEADLLELDEFKRYGDVYLSTEDGSVGEKGFVTMHSALQADWGKISCCGPMPMMKAVAAVAKAKGIDCEVSLENVMACGVGACLCCVEDTVKGNVCVCKEGPVFNIKKLKW